MRVFLHEIKEDGTDVPFSSKDAWASSAVQLVDDDSQSEINIHRTRPLREVDGHITLRRVDQMVVAQGTVKTHVKQVCGRCANDFDLPIDTHFSALYCKDPVMAGIGYLTQGGQGEGSKRKGHNYGVSREHAVSPLADEGEDLDITYLSEDVIDLGELLSEQLRLKTPIRPLCKNTCQGLCAQCGANLNQGRCACAKISKPSPFDVLKGKFDSR